MKDKLFLASLNSVKICIAVTFCFFEFSIWQRFSFFLVLLLMIVDILNGKLLRRYFKPPKMLVRVFDSVADKLAILIVVFSVFINHIEGWPIFIVLFAIEGSKLFGGVMIYKKGILFFPRAWQKICLALAGLGVISFLLGYPIFAWVGISADLVSAVYYIYHSGLLNPLVAKIVKKYKKFTFYFHRRAELSFLFGFWQGLGIMKTKDVNALSVAKHGVFVRKNADQNLIGLTKNF